MRVFLKSNTKNPFKYMFSYLEAQTEVFVYDLLIQRLDLASKMWKYLYVKSKYVSVHTVLLSKTLQNLNQNVYLNLFPPSRKPEKEIQQNSNCNTSVGSFFHDGQSRKKLFPRHFFYKNTELSAYLGTRCISMENCSPCKFGVICVLSLWLCVWKASLDVCSSWVMT